MTFTLAGTPSPTRNRNGIETTLEPCWRLTVPECSLAAGTLPVSETLSVDEAPGASEILDCPRTTCVAASLLFVPFTKQQFADAESVAALLPILVRVIVLLIGKTPHSST